MCEGLVNPKLLCIVCLLRNSYRCLCLFYFCSTEHFEIHFRTMTTRDDVEVNRGDVDAWLEATPQRHSARTHALFCCFWPLGECHGVTTSLYIGLHKLAVI